MPTPAQLRRFARVAISAAQDPSFQRDLASVDDHEADQRIMRFWEQARGSLISVIREELGARHEWESPAQFEIEVNKWSQAGFGSEDAVAWIKETSNPLAAQMLAERGWTPRMHKECRVGGRTVCELLSRSRMDPSVIPPIEVAKAARSAQKRRRHS
jgi:hypothetical protein